MILNVGRDNIVPIKDVIFIFNANCVENECNGEYIKMLNSRCVVVRVARKEAKSIIYAKVMGKEYLFYSPVAPFTLLRRARNAQIGGKDE